MADMLEPGGLAPDFELRWLDGGTQRLSGLIPNAGLLVAFFKVSCPTCQLALPFLDRLERSGSTGARIVLVSQDDQPSTRQFHQAFEISIPTLLDPAKENYPASNAFGIHHVPSLFWVEPGRRISWTDHGFRKAGIEEVAAKIGADPWRPGEYVPEWRAG